MKKILPIVLHGDAAFAGQGVWAETLNFSDIGAYSVGGTIHVIVNNLLGFTTEPRELQSTRFASSLAKRQAVPIFHVNGEDPDAVVRVGQIALEYRSAFGSDVVIDLIGYRRHGHSEVDDPTITQPLLYAKIKDHPQLWQIYAKQIGADPSATVTAVRNELESAHQAASEMQKKPRLRKLPTYWSPYKRGRYDSAYEVDTGVAPADLGKITNLLTSYPTDFAIHPKVKKLLEQRAEMGHGKRPVDYGMAEALAFGTLLLAGTPVRVTGQDTRRGTFNQRHAALVDTQNEAQYVPLEYLAPEQARCEIYNSTLSEAAVLGFEYGYSRDYPEALVLWEAQFGDFANSAQIIIDQFISAAEDKWDLPSGVGLLLPHGYEGQGPEHSSARIERYLQLAAEDNIQVCQPSNAAQYFQLLRRQALRRWRKPMIVFTPKSMLRHPDASSPIEDFERPRFEWVVPDREVTIRRARPRLQRKNRPRIARGTQTPRRYQHRHPVSRPALSVPEKRAARGDGAPSERARNGLGAGRAGEHGRAVVRPAAHPNIFSGHSSAFGEALGQRESRDGFGQGARARAENVADAGVHYGSELTGTCLTIPCGVNGLMRQGLKPSLASIVMSRLKPRPTKLVDEAVPNARAAPQ